MITLWSSIVMYLCKIWSQNNQDRWTISLDAWGSVPGLTVEWPFCAGYILASAEWPNNFIYWMWLPKHGLSLASKLIVPSTFLGFFLTSTLYPLLVGYGNVGLLGLENTCPWVKLWRWQSDEVCVSLICCRMARGAYIRPCLSHRGIT